MNAPKFPFSFFFLTPTQKKEKKRKIKKPLFSLSTDKKGKRGKRNQACFYIFIYRIILRGFVIGRGQDLGKWV